MTYIGTQCTIIVVAVVDLSIFHMNFKRAKFRKVFFLMNFY